MAVKEKNTNLSKKDSDSDKKEGCNVEISPFVCEYFNIHTFQMHPATERFLKAEAIKLKQWADLNTSIRIVDFIDQQGYHPSVFDRWCEKYEFLRNAKEYAKRRIGSRRENGALFKEMDVSTIHKTLGHYDEVFKEEAVFTAKLREDNTPNETKIIVMERFPEMPSNLTPEEVAAKVNKATRDSREYGSYNIEDRKDV